MNRFEKYQDAVSKVQSLADLRENAEMECFTWLPLKAAGVSLDVVDRYRNEMKKSDVVAGSLSFPFPIIDGLPIEGVNEIVIIEKGEYDAFRTWLREVSLIDKENGGYYRVIPCCAPLMDPFARKRKIAVPDLTYLHIFTVSGMKGILAPVWSADYQTNIPQTVNFAWKPADHEVVKEGEKILQTYS